MTFHPDSVMVGFIMGALSVVVVDRFILTPVAGFLARVEQVMHRWLDGRLRPR